MKSYNKVMEIFWLSVGILIILVVTFMGFKEGFDRWYHYYFLCVFAFGTFLMRRFMRKRMEKHQNFLNQQHNSDNNPGTTPEKP